MKTEHQHPEGCWCYWQDLYDGGKLMETEFIEILGARAKQSEKHQSENTQTKANDFYWSFRVQENHRLFLIR